ARGRSVRFDVGRSVRAFGGDKCAGRDGAVEPSGGHGRDAAVSVLAVRRADPAHRASRDALYVRLAAAYSANRRCHQPARQGDVLEADCRAGPHRPGEPGPTARMAPRTTARTGTGAQSIPTAHVT